MILVCNLVRFVFHYVAKFFLSLTFIPAFLLPFEQIVWATQNRSFTTEHGVKVSSVSAGKTSFSGPVGSVSSRLSRRGQAWRLPNHPQLPVSPITGLSVLADGQSALPSNANNFHSAVDASVNPRTGSSAFSMPVASVLYDEGQGRRDLSLSYSGGSFEPGSDALGLGSNWTFNLGVEHPSTTEIAGHKTTDITTGDGHGFTMESVRNSDGKTVWRPLRHKLKDVVITGTPGNWLIAMATGIREHIFHGYEDWEEGRDGQRVWFYYDRNGSKDTIRRLLYICAHPLTDNDIHKTGSNTCLYDGVHLTYQGRDVTIHGQQTLVLHLFDVKGSPMLKSLSMPSLSSHGVNNSSQSTEMRFDYDVRGNRPWLLQQVTEPSGQQDIFLYNQESGSSSDQPRGLPAGFSNRYIPVVTEQITIPPQAVRKSLPVKHLWYRYSRGTGDLHNYTGYQAGVSSAPGKDNLMDRADSYTYTVVQDNGFTTTETTYNKYHLPLTMVQRDDVYHTKIAGNDITYTPWRGTTFARLPATYSLPQQNSKTLYFLTARGNEDTTAPAKVVQQKRYNDKGQVIWQEDAYGRQVFTQYCPVKGDQHCPVMDPLWPQVTLPEKVLMLPAAHTPLGSAPYHDFAVTADPAPATEVVYDYTRLPVAAVYKDKLRTYQQLLKHRKSLQADVQVSDNATGEDTSALAGQWQVKAKTEGTLPLDSVAGLKPGVALPELMPSQIGTRTDYQYNHEQNSLTYGQLTQLTLTKIADTSRKYRVDGLLPELIKMPVAARQTQDKVTINVTTTLTPETHTRKTTMAVLSATSPESIREAKAQLHVGRSMADGNSFSLGTSVYSLVSGVKLASDDTLKNLHSIKTYDVWQRPVKEVITPLTGGRPQTVTWSYINTDREQAVVRTAPDGTQQKIVYAGTGKNRKILSAWHRFKSESKAGMEGLSNWIPDSKTTYTVAGKPATRTVYHAADPDSSTPGKTIALTTTYGYDALNRQVWKKTPDGVIKFTVRNDPAMWLIDYQVATGWSHAKSQEKTGTILTVIQSNILGKPVGQYTFSLIPSLKLNGKPVYNDFLQHQLQGVEDQLKPSSSLHTTKSYGLMPLVGKHGLSAFIRAAIKDRAWLTRVVTTYDGNGRRIAQTQPNGATTHWTWRRGRLVAVTAPNGSMIHDTFNVFGKKTSRCVQPSGSNICHSLGERGYDREGNLAWQEDEHGNRITYHYDADGRLLSMITPATKNAPKGHIFTYTYSSIGQTGAAIDGVLYVKYTYDPVTWKLTDKEDAISHVHYSFDENTGQLIKITRSTPVTFKTMAGIYYPVGTESIVYDRYNKPVRRTDLAGNVFVTTHDVLGRPIKTSVFLPGQRKATVLTSTRYDDYFNRPTEITNGMGVTRTFTYDPLNLLKKTTDRRAGVLLESLKYNYDTETRNIIGMTRVEGNASATQSYTYDRDTNDLTRMTCSATGKANALSLLCPRDTDLVGSANTKPLIILSQKYTFDHWNNIQSVTEKLLDKEGKKSTKIVHYAYTTGNPASGSGSLRYRYDPHQMTSFSRQWQNSGISEPPQTITYDVLGRVIKDADGNTIHYNAFGQQDSFTSSLTGEKARYTYDSSGHQVEEQPFDAKGNALQSPLYMLYQGNTITAQVQNDSFHHQHISVEFGVAHSEDGAITRWYTHDYKGDVISTFGAEGRRRNDYVYSPYGMSYDRLANAHQALATRLHLSEQKPWWKNHSPGFDKQMNDPATGYQFLGGGLRAYNPVYRHFMSHDSYSPFKIIDGYGFGSNNPVMNTDPTGHIPKWLSYTLGGIGIVAALASAALLPVVSVVLPSSMGLTLTGFNSITAGTSAVASAIAGTAAGSLQIASTARPENRNLAIANSSFGIVSSVSAIGMGLFVGPVSMWLFSHGLECATTTFIITSSITGTISGVFNTAIYGASVASISHPEKLREAMIDEELAILSYISLALTAVSVTTALFGMINGVQKAFLRRFPSEIYHRDVHELQIELKSPPIGTDATTVFENSGPLSLLTEKYKQSGASTNVSEQPTVSPMTLHDTSLGDENFQTNLKDEVTSQTTMISQIGSEMPRSYTQLTPLETSSEPNISSEKQIFISSNSKKKSASAMRITGSGRLILVKNYSTGTL